MLLTAIEREKAQIREEGKKEGSDSRAQQIARTMLANGFAPTQIAELTALPVAEVMRLRDQAADTEAKPGAQ